MATGAKTQMILGVQEATGFWIAVADCMVRFHHVEPGEATRRTQKLREDLYNIPQPEEFRDLIYHEEPWTIACNLAGRVAGSDEAILRPDDWAAYESILKRNGLFPAEVGEAPSPDRA